jgi:pyruvate ferredoxin oxidoreductase beta subunit
MDSGMVTNAVELTNKEYFYGHKACAGCGGSLAVRLALKVLGQDTFVALPANCMAAVSFLFPNLSFTTNAMITPFAATASVLSGMAAGAKALGLKDCHIVGFAGDGGTADIGIQALSGAIDRKEPIIYICYDNEAYMNTGIQKSGLTPYGARTTTSPAGHNLPGATSTKKNMFEIVAAHGIAYAATASIGYPEDYLRKVSKAARCKETAYIHVMAPCCTGWGFPSDMTVEVAKEGVDCGLWFLAEYEDGEFTLNRKQKVFAPVRDYLMKQSRFKHLKNEHIALIESERDRRWDRMLRDWN